VSSIWLCTAYKFKNKVFCSITSGFRTLRTHAKLAYTSVPSSQLMYHAYDFLVWY
jgi:hypothetical protein